MTPYDQLKRICRKCITKIYGEDEHLLVITERDDSKGLATCCEFSNECPYLLEIEMIIGNYPYQFHVLHVKHRTNVGMVIRFPKDCIADCPFSEPEERDCMDCDQDEQGVWIEKNHTGYFAFYSIDHDAYETELERREAAEGFNDS